jgi:hypothetical protein
LISASCSFGERALDHRQHVLVGAALQRLRRREARRAIRRDELQRRDGRGELAPHPVVEDDVVARFGSGSTLAPVARSIAAPSFTRSTVVSPTVCTSPSAATAAAAGRPRHWRQRARRWP